MPSEQWKGQQADVHSHERQDATADVRRHLDRLFDLIEITNAPAPRPALERLRGIVEREVIAIIGGHADAVHDFMLNAVYDLDPAGGPEADGERLKIDPDA